MTNIPEGWKLVPVEPTPEMLQAADKAEMRHVIEDRRRGGNDPLLSWTAAYKAMLASSPPVVLEPAAAREGVSLTDAQIIEIAKRTQSAEPGRDGYILPIQFARAILAAVPVDGGQTEQQKGGV